MSVSGWTKNDVVELRQAIEERNATLHEVVFLRDGGIEITFSPQDAEIRRIFYELNKIVRDRHG